MIDHSEPLIELLFQAAFEHGAEEGSDVEAGDLQEMLRATWSLLTPEQRQGFFIRPEITALGTSPSTAESRWLWKGRRVHLFDESSVAMPDTPANRKDYPLTYNQKPGTGFAVARIAAVISLSCGAILDLGYLPVRGERTKRIGAAAAVVGPVPRR